MVSNEIFKKAMASLASGTSAITGTTADGTPFGLLATAVFSYSVEPPTLAISISHASRSHQHLLDSSTIAVHILGYNQLEVARVLASKSNEKFDQFNWTLKAGVPVIDDCLVEMVCETPKSVEYLDHTMIFARVLEVEVTPGEPLVYFQNSFQPLLNHVAAV